MKNGDLKRFYEVDKLGPKDFLRLNDEGKVDKDLLPLDENGDLLVTITSDGSAYEADVEYDAILAAFPKVKAIFDSTNKIVFLPDAITGDDITFTHVHSTGGTIALQTLTINETTITIN